MLRGDLLSVEVEMEASSSGAAAEGLVVAASPARRTGVGVVIAIVGGRHSCGSYGDVSRRFVFVYSSSRSAM